MSGSVTVRMVPSEKSDNWIGTTVRAGEKITIEVDGKPALTVHGNGTVEHLRMLPART